MTPTPDPIAPACGAYSSRGNTDGRVLYGRLDTTLGGSQAHGRAVKSDDAVFVASGLATPAGIKPGPRDSHSASATLSCAAPALRGTSLETTAAGASASVAGFLADASSHLTTFAVAALSCTHVASCSSDIPNL